MAGCGHLEDAQHVFLLCPHFASLWSMVRAWIGFDGVDNQAIHDHFHQFIDYTGGLKARRNFLHLIWLLCSWILWNERNNRLFKNQECTSYQLLEKVKYCFWYPNVVVESPNVFGYWLAIFSLVTLWTTCIFNSLFGTPCTEEIIVVLFILACSKRKVIINYYLYMSLKFILF